MKLPVYISSFMITLILLTFFIALLSETFIFEWRGIEDRVADSTMKSVQRQVPSLATIELDYIASKTHSCRHNQGDVLPRPKFILGLIDISQSELEESAKILLRRCLRRYITDADTLQDMIARHKQLSSLSPYDAHELAALSRE